MEITQTGFCDHRPLNFNSDDTFRIVRGEHKGISAIGIAAWAEIEHTSDPSEVQDSDYRVVISEADALQAFRYWETLETVDLVTGKPVTFQADPGEGLFEGSYRVVSEDETVAYCDSEALGLVLRETEQENPFEALMRMLAEESEMELE